MIASPFSKRFSNPLSPAQFVAGDSTTPAGGGDLEYMGASLPAVFSPGGLRSTSLTVTSESNRILILFAVKLNNWDWAQVPKFNGVTMTVKDSFYVNNFRMFSYYLLESSLPPAGTYNLTAQDEFPGGRGAFWGLWYKNAKQETPGIAESSGASGTNWTTSIITTESTQQLCDAVVAAGTLTATQADQTEITETNDLGFYYGGSKRINLGVPGSKLMGWSQPISNAWNQMILSIKQA